MKGGSLKQFIIERYKNKENFLFRDEECALIMLNLLEGLNYIHNSHIIHRDIKPENIMLGDKTDFNSIKICDFGVSTTFLEQEEKRSSFCGTTIYMAPEIFNKQANETTDIWACGFILHILCGGGMHPIFRPSMKMDKYKDELKNMKDWELPEKFPM